MMNVIASTKQPASRSFTEEWPRIVRASRFQIIYCTVFCILYCGLYAAGQQSLFSWAVLAVDVLCLAMRKPSLPVLYSAFLVGNELASILILAVWMLMSENVNLARLASLRISKSVLCLVALMVALSLGQSAREGTIANTVLSCTYLLIVGLVIFSCRQAVTYKDALSVTCCMVVAEFFASLLICLKAGFEPGDAHYGTMGNAHFIGIACSFALIFIAFAWLRRKEIATAHALALIAMLVFVMWEADAKSAIGAGFISLALFGLFWLVKASNGTIVAYLWTAILLFLLGSLLLQVPNVQAFLLSSSFPLHSFFADYVYESGLQNKFDYFMGTASQMVSDGHIFYGYGLGTYGSRFANMLGYTYTYRDPSAINELAAALFKSRMIPEYAQFASQYNETVVAVIGSFSAVLTYPFASFVALIGESGLLGVAIMGFMLKKAKLSSMSQFCVAFFIGVCLTDMYFDHIQILGFLIMLCAALNQLARDGHSSDCAVAEMEKQSCE